MHNIVSYQVIRSKHDALGTFFSSLLMETLLAFMLAMPSGMNLPLWYTPEL